MALALEVWNLSNLTIGALKISSCSVLVTPPNRLPSGTKEDWVKFCHQISSAMINFAGFYYATDDVRNWILRKRRATKNTFHHFSEKKAGLIFPWRRKKNHYIGRVNRFIYMNSETYATIIHALTQSPTHSNIHAGGMRTQTPIHTLI